MMNWTKLICHRKPERSFFFRGHQFPVCARCTGFYITVFLYFIYTFYYYINYNLVILIIAILLLVPAGIDGFTQLFKFRESTNFLRLVTGLMGGLGLGIIVKAIKFFIYLI